MTKSESPTADLLAKAQQLRLLNEQIEATLNRPQSEGTLRADLLEKAEELRVLGEAIDETVKKATADRLRLERRHTFTSSDRKYFYHFPRWLWISIVTVLGSLFLLALYSAGGR